MAITHGAATRNLLATTIKNQLEAGAGAPVMEVRTSGGTTLLATVTLNDPVGTVTNETLAFSGLPASDNSIDATGTAAVVQFKDSDANIVFSGSITQNGAGGDVQLTSSDSAALNFVAGNTFSLNSFSYTAPV